jgi:hypothetical protein
MNCTMQTTYTNFSNIGDAATYGEAFAFYSNSGDLGTCSMTNSTFNNVGPWATPPSLTFGSGAVVNLNNSVWTNSPCATATLGCLPIATQSGASVSVQNGVFDFCVGTGNTNQTGINWSGSYLGRGTCGAMVSAVAQANLFNHQVVSPGSIALQPGGNLTNSYYFLDITQDNPHWLVFPNTSVTVSGLIYDDPDDVTADSGEMWQEQTGANTEQFNNNILLPSKTGHGNSELSSATNTIPGASTLMQEYHNTWTGSSTAGAFAMQQVNEDGASVAVNALESNLAWSKGAAFPYCKVGTVGTASMTTNPVTTADYNYADANAIQAGNGSASCSDGVCTNGTCTNQGNSYLAKWTATPGAHDVDVLHPSVTSPNLADAARNLFFWDTNYLHDALGTAWTSGTSYAVGQIVSDSHAGYYGGAPINFRCIANHTSGSTTEPLVGASWRTDWEAASLYDIRTAMAANMGSGTTYTDWAIGCASGCTAIQALVGWVRKGFTPQAPALWCAGHDGEAVGAVPFCASGKILMGTLAGM